MIRHIGILFSLLSAFFAFSQKPYVELIVQPSNVEVGEAFNVIVKSNISGEINIDLPDGYDQGYSVMNSMEQDFDGNTGEVITFYFHARTGTINKEGKFNFGPAYVRKGNKVYRSNKVQVTANSKGTESNESIEASLFRKPACGSIKLSKEKAYQGEPVVVESKVAARFKPTHYDSYQSYSIESGADQHKLGGPQEVLVRNENNGNKKRFVFELDKQVVFFNNPGRIKIDPFEMTLQSGFDGFQIHSKRNFIRVIPLPDNAPSSFTGGVGKFEISSTFDKTQLKQGEITTLTIKISGSGNLHDLSNPKLVLPSGLKMYGDPERKEKFSFTEKGAEGTIHIQYHLQAIQDGNVKFSPIAFSYFNPEMEKYIVKYGSPGILKVDIDPSFVLASNSSTKESSNSKIERFNDNNAKKKSLFSNPVVKWVGISAPLCLAFLFLFFRVRKNKEVKSLSSSEPVNEELPKEKIEFNEWLSVLQSHVDTGNVLLFFTQLSKNLQNSASQAARSDVNWVLSREETQEFFNQKSLPLEFQKEFFSLQQTCELCRYGCQMPEEDLSQYLDRAKTIFQNLDSI